MNASFKKINLIIFGLVIAIVLLEIGLRLGGAFYLLKQEHTNVKTLNQEDIYRILCLGESTTASGGNHSYPNQLHEILNSGDAGIKFSVINKGIPSTDTGYILADLDKNLDKYKPDMIIAMMGVNDSKHTFKYKGNFNKFSFLKQFRVYKIIKLLWEHIKYKINNFSNRISSEVSVDNDGALKEQLINFKTVKFKKEKEKNLSVNGVNPIKGGEFTGAIKNLEEKGKSKLGWDCLGLGRYAEAERVFKHIIKMHPENSSSYVGLGRIYQYKREFIKSEKMFLKAGEIDAQDTEVLMNIGWFYNVVDRYADAIDAFEKVLEKNSKHTRAYLELAWCFEKLGKYEEVELILMKAIEMGIEDANLYNKIASCYTKQGNNSEGAKFYNKANRLRLAEDDSITEYNYRRLKEIVKRRGIKLVCVQYPMRSIEQLKIIIGVGTNVVYVDNEILFKNAVKLGKYGDCFIDNFAGDFGHTTNKGSRMLAENIANVILNKWFIDKQ